MGNKHLTNLYRPQTFAQVLGQDALCRILSRAAGQRKLAPAYMFSGTRGVGKTTVARILAKAINCRHGPAEEPCTECRFCRQIAQGSAVDVMEVDGASNTGVDNVRRLTEEIGYAPVDCRYKVIIIDEAHMLSRSAFNALLKTLEEPPSHALFILATTEPHKFPSTIVSRCQHFVFKRLPLKDLQDHLQDILQRESVPFEPEAVSLLARKGGGSVRDSLSLLSQILALGEEEIRLDTVKDVLGIAGREILQEIMRALSQQDCAGLVAIVRRLLDQGLDIGFFLQELTSAWRNMFLLKQIGEQGREALDIPQEEAELWSSWAGTFSLSHLHACWQMTLEEQRRVLSSMDAALALELLLLNLAYLPSLVPVQDLEKGAPTAETQGGVSLAGEADTDAEVSAGDGFLQEPPDAARVELEGETEAESGPAGDWNGFLRFLAQKETQGLPGFRLSKGRVEGDTVRVTCPNYLVQRMKEPDRYNRLLGLVREYFGRELSLELECENGNSQGTADLRSKVMNDPTVQNVMQQFQAEVVEIKKR
ncbi:MAG: DNA polymerase III subunit gamma/tau [Desulfohalobiaceae bacterium]|nr:DNA polymerase III subunit gamma/tau [Desulfohalobiaceae bacterium]